MNLFHNAEQIFTVRDDKTKSVCKQQRDLKKCVVKLMVYFIGQNGPLNVVSSLIKFSHAMKDIRVMI